MKRLLFAGALAAFLVGVPASHMVLADPPGKVTLCHVTDDPENPGVVIMVSVRAEPDHRSHGDCDAPEGALPSDKCECTTSG